MDKFEYLSGLPEVGIVPRAPHVGPLLRELYEQEHGRGGFSGKVAHTYHLYPPNNWLPGETRALDGGAFAPDWESPLEPIGGIHHALEATAPAAPRDVYRGMARLVANATVTMNVTAPAVSMDYFFEHHSATCVYFIHEGRGILETTFGPIEYRKGDFLILPKGTLHRFVLAAGPQYYWMYESFAGDPQKSETASTGRFITHSASDYKFPRSLDTRNEAGHFEVISKTGTVYMRRVHPTHPLDVVGWRGDYLPYRFAVEDVRPLVADRSHGAALRPHRLHAAGLLSVRLHGALRGARRHVAAVLSQEPRLPRDHRLPLRRFLQPRRGDPRRHGHTPSRRAPPRTAARGPESIHGGPPARDLARGRDHGGLRGAGADVAVRPRPVAGGLHGKLGGLHDRSALRVPRDPPRRRAGGGGGVGLGAR